MKIIITGGGGFLGHQLCKLLRARGNLCGTEISEMVLMDAYFHRPLTDPRVRRSSFCWAR